MILQYMYYSTIKLFIHPSIYLFIHTFIFLSYHIDPSCVYHLILYKHPSTYSFPNHIYLILSFYSYVSLFLTHNTPTNPLVSIFMSIYLSIGAVCIVFLLIQRQLTLDYLSIYLSISDLIGFLYPFYASIKAIESSDAKDER